MVKFIMTELRSTTSLQDNKDSRLILRHIQSLIYFTSMGKNLETSMINRLRKKQTEEMSFEC